jgi:SAM-dependent methyltransferase
VKKSIRSLLYKLLALIPEDAPVVAAAHEAPSPAESVALPEAAFPVEAPILPEAASPAEAIALPEAVSPAEAIALPYIASPTESPILPGAASIEEATPLPDALPPPLVINPVLMRDAFRHYLTGSGVEVGALHNPLDISELAITSIRYVDRLPEDELTKLYPELEGQPLVHVDIVDDAERLATIPDASVDFIIGNHFLEHTRNPIGTIHNWLKKLAPGGVLFLAIPDQRYTFDVSRTLTPLEHIVEDYQCDPADREKRDHQHFLDWSTYVYNLSGEAAIDSARYLEGIDYSIHFHTFRLQSFLGLLKYMEDELHIPLEIKACADVSTGGNEFLVILSPKAADTPQDTERLSSETG